MGLNEEEKPKWKTRELNDGLTCLDEDGNIERIVKYN